MTSHNDESTRGRFTRAMSRLRGAPANAGQPPREPGGPQVLVAPVTGTAVALSETEDPAFSAGFLGPGIAVRPTRGDVVVPATGTIITALPHAYGVRTESGVEILVHVGVDTVGLAGKYFTSHVRQGQHVYAGNPLVHVDLEQVAAAGYPTTVMLVVTNAAGLRQVTPHASGRVEAGQPVVTVIVR